MRVDAHAHVWQAIPAAASGVPTIVPPQADVPAELLSVYLDDHAVERAVLVQPVYPGEDNSYVAKVARSAPERFAAVCVVDPRKPNAGERLAYWAGECGCCGLRLRPRIPEEGILFGQPGTFELWEAAARLSVVVSVLANFQQLPICGQLAQRFESVPIVIDHLGQPPLPFLTEMARPLLDLAEFQNVYIKLSGFYYLSRQGFPFSDCRDLTRAVYDRFGARRLIWGSDFPHVLLKTGYSRAILVIDELCDWLSAGEKKLVMGGNAARLYWPSD